MGHTGQVREKAGAAALYLGGASAVAVLVSIAASQILLTLALASLIASRLRLRLPRIAWLLGLFLAGTVLSTAFSANPAAGRPQIRKFFVYLVLLVVFSTFRKLAHARGLVLSWAAVGAVSAGVALAQFGRKVVESQQHGADFYRFYVGERISGFMSHWMTFSGEGMIALVLLGAFLLFGRLGRLAWPAAAAFTVLGLALIGGFTRAVWLGAAAGVLYLLWYGKRKLLWGLPAAVAGLMLVPAVRARIVSAVQPHGELDSNQHRIVCWRTGLAMIEAHPLLGLGPEMVKAEFLEYVPADVPRPLPEGWYGHLHNIYLHYAAERGVPTALALTIMLLVMLRDFRRAALRLPAGRSDAKFVLHGAAATVLAIMVAGVFEHNLGDSEVLTMFLAVAGIGYTAVEASQETGDRRQEVSVGAG